MNLLKSLCAAFSMYSKIPVSRAEWDEGSMKYALCFFPLVGAVIALFETAVFYICRKYGFGDIIRAAFMTAVPVLVSGGIHADGFMDTVDAVSSYADRDEKLQILKDPHCGAFAVIGAVIYFLLFFALMCGIDTWEGVIITSLGFVASRALSALMICYLKCAKGSGLLHTFAHGAKRGAVIGSSWTYLLLFFAAMALINSKAAVCAAAAALAAILHYVHTAAKFGGITGDLAGYFVCVCELLFVIVGGVTCVLL